MPEAQNDNRLFDLELKISKVLRYGVLIAGSFILVGWAMEIQWSGNPFSGFQKYREEPLFRHLRLILDTGEWGFLCAYFGLALLISLPLVRVLMTAYLFFRQREYAMAAIAGFVLFGLILGISLGFEL